MKVEFADEHVRGRCRALILMDEIEYRKIRVEQGKGRYYTYLVRHGFIEALHPFKPVNEWNSYRLTSKGSTMKKVLMNLLKEETPSQDPPTNALRGHSTPAGN